MVVDKLNRPVQDLRISVIDRCNFRCTYCMPEGSKYSFLKKQDWLSFDDIERVSRAFKDLGVRKLRITGGEPLLRPDVHTLVKQLASIPGIQDLALTTNGMLLKDHAQQLRKAGLRRLTVSLDAMDVKVFSAMSGHRGDLATVLKGIDVAQSVGFKKIKINVVVQKGVNDHQIMDLVNYFRGTGHIIRFIEYMDVGNCNHWQKNYVLPSKEILAQIQKIYPLEPVGEDYYGEVAKRYHFSDGNGEIGFISSISQPFCSSCTRVRLTADGKIVTCLFATDGISIKECLHSGATDEQLLEVVSNIWRNRKDQYSVDRLRHQPSKSDEHKLEMYHVGG